MKKWLSVSCIGICVLLLAALVLTSAWGKETMLDSRNIRIARVVERYVALNYKGFESLKYEMVVEEDSENLVVNFKLPDGMLGGTPTVVLKKTTLDVLRAYQSQ